MLLNGRISALFEHMTSRQHKHSWTANGLIFFLFLTIYIILHGYSCIREGLHIDEVIDYSGERTDFFLAAGRWGLYWYREAMGGGTLNLTAGLLAGVILSLSIIFQCHLFNLTTNLHKALYGMLYFACNQWESMLTYRNMCDGFAIGVFLCTASVWFLSQQKRGYIPAFLSFTAALSMYQCCAVYILVLWLCWAYANKTFNLSFVIRFAVISLASLASYFLINSAFKDSPLIDDFVLSFVQKYQNDITQWDNFGELSGSMKFLFLLHYVKHTVLSALGLDSPMNLAQTSVLVPLVGLAVVLPMRSREKQRLIDILLLVCIWCLPFIMHIVMGNISPRRTILAEPVAFAFLWISMLKPHLNHTKINYSVFACVGFLVLKASYSNSITARNNSATYNFLVREMNNINQAGQLLARQHNLKSNRIVILSHDDAQGFEKLSWAMKSLNGLNNTQSLHWYTKHLNLPDLIEGDEQLRAKHKEAYDHMPCWPAPDSMRIHKGEIIVRITP